MKYLEHCHEIDHSKETKSKVRDHFWLETVCNLHDFMSKIKFRRSNFKNATKVEKILVFGDQSKGRKREGLNLLDIISYRTRIELNRVKLIKSMGSKI